jgi:hypothetical protein
MSTWSICIINMLFFAACTTVHGIGHEILTVPTTAMCSDRTPCSTREREADRQDKERAKERKRNKARKGETQAAALNGPQP